DLTKGQQRAPEYLALNPTGRTPVLVDGDFILWESNAILQYLGCRTANALWPDDVRTRADIMRWQSWQLAHWHQEACVPLIFERLIKSMVGRGPPDVAVVARATEAFNREAKVLDAHLAKNAYLVGTAITLADFSVAAPLFYVKEAGLPVGGHPHLEEWFA